MKSELSEFRFEAALLSFAAMISDTRIVSPHDRGHSTILGIRPRVSVTHPGVLEAEEPGSLSQKICPTCEMEIDALDACIFASASSCEARPERLPALLPSYV